MRPERGGPKNTAIMPSCRRPWSPSLAALALLAYTGVVAPRSVAAFCKCPDTISVCTSAALFSTTGDNCTLGTNGVLRAGITIDGPASTQLTTIDLSDVIGVLGDVKFEVSIRLTTVDLSGLQIVAGDLAMITNVGLTSMLLTSLVLVVAEVIVDDNDVLTRLDLSSLQAVAGDVTVVRNDVLPELLLTSFDHDVAQEELKEQEQELVLELGLEPAMELAPGMEAVAMAELGDGGHTPVPKQGEKLAASPPGDEPPSAAVRLRRFQLLEHLWSSGDTTVIDRDKSKYSHTHTSGVRPISGMPL
eukprot:COSAG01_NODE_170_length_23136_cov_24.853931_14_plen_303_part_00